MNIIQWQLKCFYSVLLGGVLLSMFMGFQLKASTYEEYKEKRKMVRDGFEVLNKVSVGRRKFNREMYYYLKFKNIIPKCFREGIKNRVRTKLQEIERFSALGNNLISHGQDLKANS